MSPKDVTMWELSALLVCHAGCGRREMPTLILHPSLPVTDRELTLPLNSCSARESRPCPLPGQHSRADPMDGVLVSIPENVSMEDLGPSPICRMLVWAVERHHSPPRHCHHLLPVTGGKLALRSYKRERSPCPSPAAALGRVAPTPLLR